MALVRRRTELGLIVFGVGITAATYMLVALGETSTLPRDVGPFFGTVLALIVGAHIAVRRLAPGADSMLLPMATLLNGIGYVFIARLDEAMAKPKGLAQAQAGWAMVGIAAFIATLVVIRRPRDLARYRYTFLLLGVLLLMMPLIPGVGQEISGARIWVQISVISFQPGEFAKVVLAIFFAAYLVEKRELLGMATWPRFAPVLPDPKHLGPVMLAWGSSVLVMVAEKDLGSSLLFFALFISMVWVATQRNAYMVVGGGLFLGGAFLAHQRFNHVRERVSTWLDPWSAFGGKGYQVAQSWFALAWGGVAGTGLGLGSPTTIPVVTTDFIFSAIGEELGLLGTAAILFAYLLMVGSGLRIALATEDPFEKLLATGLTVLIGVQSFIIMAGVTRLLPLTGVTLPFVSYGGSSLVANYVLIALLMRISDSNAQRAGEIPSRPTRKDKRRARRQTEAALA